MTRPPYDDLIRLGYEAFDRGDLASAMEIFDDEIVWLVPGNNKISGKYTGREEVLGLFSNIMRLTDGQFRLALRHVVADDEVAVALVTVTVAQGADTRTYDTAQVWHLAAGKAVTFQEFVDDQRTIDQVFS